MNEIRPNPEILSSPVIHELSEKLDLPKERIARTYQNEMDELAKDAKVHSFIPIIAMRRTREVLVESD